VDEANKPGSLVRMQVVELDPDALHQKTVTFVSQPILATSLGIQPWQVTSSTVMAGQDEPLLFGRLDQQEIARVAERVIQRMEDRPGDVPSATYLSKQSVQAEIAREVVAEYRPIQPMLAGVVEPPDIDAIVAKTCEAIRQQTIDIPRIVVLPKGHISGFHSFTLDLTGLRYAAVSQELWIQHLRTNQREVVSLGSGNIQEQRLEDYVVAGLVDFDDISYDIHADLLFDLAAQVTKHFLGYLSEDETRKVLQCYQKPIAQFVHAQMQAHYWEKADAYEVKVNKSFTARLKESAYTQLAGEPTHDFRQAPDDKSNMARYLFGGFSKCLYKVQKFQSDSERRLAVILDREALKWFKPAKGQFLIFYRRGSQQSEYLPDFVAETVDTIYMLEPKARNELDDSEVLAKKAAAEEWCRHASEHTATYGGKPWQYALIAHDVIFENMTINGLVP
jgi:type III restriction enzyme